MVDYKTEEEQIEAVKRWWGQNGRTVVFAVVIGVSGSFGWQFWQDSKQEGREQAALEYWQFVEFLERDFISIDVSQPDIIGNKIKSSFPKSNYSKFAAMHLARIYVDAKKFDKAENELRWVVKKSNRMMLLGRWQVYVWLEFWPQWVNRHRQLKCYLQNKIHLLKHFGQLFSATSCGI